MTLYRILHPILVFLFQCLVAVLKLNPRLRSNAEKLIRTWDIRTISGRPAFYSIDPKLFRNERPVWIHAASGEFEYAKPVIRELKKQNPELGILVTYFSPTYADNVRKFPGVTASCPLPLDSSGEIREFLQYLNPRCLLIARTDAWPNTIREVTNQKIPTLLFSTTFHEESKRSSSWLARRITRKTLSLISKIQCVSHDDKNLLSQMDLERVEVAGDTRYDQVLNRLSLEKTPMILAQTAAIKSVIHERSLTAGSVWSEDLEPLLVASFQNRKKTPHTLLIVPHEVSDSFSNEIESRAQAAGFKKERIAQFSRLSRATTPIDVLIVDTVGLLAELYQLSEVAFVGGSFRKTVHSVMEPLAAGCLTIVGPLHTNNREAIEFQRLKFESDQWAFVTCAQDATQFIDVLDQIFERGQDPIIRRKSSERVTDAVKNRGGATERVLTWMKQTELLHP